MAKIELEAKIKHLEFTQDVITRMGANSFAIKGWAILIIVALLAVDLNVQAQMTYLAFAPIVILWILDSYYLYQERLFRKVYEAIRTDKMSNFEMNVKKYDNGRGDWFNSFTSKTMIIFYGLLCLTVIIFIIFINNATCTTCCRVK